MKRIRFDSRQTVSSHIINVAKVLYVVTSKQTFRVNLTEPMTLTEIRDYLFRRTSKYASCKLYSGLALAEFH
jgi:hypothetical protein